MTDHGHAGTWDVTSAVSWAQQYAHNRSRFKGEDLAKYQGKWVAFSRDGSTIIAAAKSQLDLARKLETQGVERTEYRMEPIPDLDAPLVLQAGI